MQDQTNPNSGALAGPNVRFLGERTDIPQLLWAADACVISSTVEGLPLAFLEAAACGLPCLATDVGGIRETQIGFVLQNSTELRPGLERMASLSESERQQLGRSAGRSLRRDIHFRLSRRNGKASTGNC